MKKVAVKKTAPRAARPVDTTSEEKKEGESRDDGEGDHTEGENYEYPELLKQIAAEHKSSYDYIKPKWDEWALRIKLYNNQKRDKEAVGDNTLFTIFQTVLASLYMDELSIKFEPRETGDDEIAENLDITAQYDYGEMEKDILDYEWDFEAMFFGRGLCSVQEFDRENMIPVPEIWHAMTVLRDPNATSVNGDKKGRGRARFLGREIRMTKDEMRKMGVYKDFETLKESDTSTRSLVDENRRIVSEAAGLADVSKFTNIPGENKTYRLFEWYTMHAGKRVYVTTSDDFSRIVRYQEMDDVRIPIIDRAIFPIPNSWDGVSVPDLIEDKQRARAVSLNLAIKGVKSGLHPMYLFDETRIHNKGDLNFEFNKFIGVKGNPSNAVVPMQRDGIKQDVQYILDTLSAGAERSTATPDIQQGARPDQAGTATRDTLLAQRVDTRYSLSARIFGWSEKRFWRHWYWLYKKHFKDGIDEKTVRIVGALGAQWRPITRENLIGNTDPDVSVDSRILSETRRFNELQQFRAYVQYIQSAPNANLLFALRYMGKLSGLKKDIIDRLLPPTIQEMIAEEENVRLREGDQVDVSPTDDHQAHMEIHNKMEDTPAKYAHINAHKKGMLLQEIRPDLFPQLQENSGVSGEGVRGAPVATPGEAVAFRGRALPVK